MNKYNVEVEIIIEASNQEAAEDIIRDILENDEAVADYQVKAINDQ